MRVQIRQWRVRHTTVPAWCESHGWRSHGGATAQPRRDSSDDDDAQSSWSSYSPSNAAAWVTAVPAAAHLQTRCWEVCWDGKQQSKTLPWCRAAKQDFVKIVHVACEQENSHFSFCQFPVRHFPVLQVPVTRLQGPYNTLNTHYMSKHVLVDFQCWDKVIQFPFISFHLLSYPFRNRYNFSFLRSILAA